MPTQRYRGVMKWLALTAFLALAACDALPKDSAGTLDRVQAGHVFRVGLIAGSGGICPDRSRAFLAEVSRRAGAAPRVATGAADGLINALREGELDLVLGEVAHDSPWATEVSILEPLAADCPGAIDYSAIGRNGENRWIMLLEESGRAVGREGGA